MPTHAGSFYGLQDRPVLSSTSPSGFAGVGSAERLTGARLERENRAGQQRMIAERLRRQKELEQQRLDRDAQARLQAQYGEQSLFPGSGSAGFRPVLSEGGGAPKPRFSLPTGALGPGFQPTAQDYAQAGRMASEVGKEVAFGPERQSVFGGNATRGERTLRDWGLSEQEFRASGSAFDEGRPFAGLGFGALAVAGAVPLFGQAGRGLVKGAGALGDVVRAAGAVPDAGRAAETAADVVRAADVTPSPMVFADNIADDYLKEISGPELFSHQNPNIQNVSQERRTVAELAYRQGFEAPPRIVDSQVFDSIVPRRAAVERERLPLQHRSAPDDNVLYRGFETQADPTDQFGRFRTSEYYADQLINGDYYVGHGIRGHGTYFTVSPVESLQYTGTPGARYLPDHSDPQAILGSVVRARIAPEARLLDGFSELTMAQFRNSRFGDISEFAAAHGYDGIRYTFYGAGRAPDHIVMLNRSAITFDSRIAKIDNRTAIELSNDWRLTKKFADTMFSDSPFLPPSLPQPPFGGIG